eukprot:TRINITY_DN66354_c12_g1_i4.p5 TRINITY_DN66354_c12_g1~~TRINITY_DN66354_c12_g1_i4.p5  ORF type:complete len:107 (+),score=22.92 TRINITY_DN66354_c12_g1_i4:785-1105(+)
MDVTEQSGQSQCRGRRIATLDLIARVEKERKQRTEKRKKIEDEEAENNEEEVQEVETHDQVDGQPADTGTSTGGHPETNKEDSKAGTAGEGLTSGKGEAVRQEPAP